MARFYFPPTVVLLPPDDDGIPRVAATRIFRLFSDESSGEEYTNLVHPDGVSSLDPVTDNSGQTPPLRGPDDVRVMWCDAGSGKRYPMYSSEALGWLLDNYEPPGSGSGTDIDGGMI